MPVPVGAILALLDIAGNERVHKGIGSLWSRLPFGRDAKVAARVEGRAQTLATELAALARTLGASDLEAEVARRFDRFEREIVADGVAEANAPEIRQEVERTLRHSVLDPVRELLGLQARIEDLEGRALAAETRASDATKAIRRAAALSSLAFAFGVAGLLLALIAIIRG